MAIPRQVFTTVDPGIPKATDSTVIPFVIGCCTQGSTTAIQTITSPSQAASTYGEGPLARAIAHILRYGGGPVRALRLATSTAGACSAVTQVGSGPTITVTTATAKDRYAVTLTVVTGGALNTAKVTVSLDDWGDPNIAATVSQPLLLPTGGVLAIPGTGITITGAAGTYVVGDTYHFTSTEPGPDDSTLAALSSTILAYQNPWSFLYLAGDVGTASAVATRFSAVDSLMTALETGFLFKRAIINGSRDTAANVAAGSMATTLTSRRVSVMYGEAQCTGTIPLSGYEANPRQYAGTILAARVASNLVSTDPMRVGSGSLPGALSIFYDEFISGTLNDLKIGTLRTYPGISGFFITNGWIKSGSTSDFKYIQHGLVMDLACQIMYSAQAKYLGASLRTQPSTGAISLEDKARIEADVGAQLRASLLDPLNVEGTKGHVSDLDYEVLTTNNMLADETLYTDLGVQPIGYPKTIRTTFGFRIVA